MGDSPIVADTPGGISNPSRLGFGVVPGSWMLIRIPSVPAVGSIVLSKPGMV